MPNRTINQLDPNAGLNGTEELPLWNVDDSKSEKTTLDSITTFVESNIDVSGAVNAGISTHESTYDHTKIHDAATAGTGIDVTGQVISNTDTGSAAVSSHESTYNHSNYNTAYSHSQATGNPHGTTASQVGALAAVPGYIPPQASPGTVWPWQEGLLFYDWTSHTWCYYNEHSGVTVNIGEESLIHGVNKDDINMLDGYAVLISGQQGPQPKFLCAKGDTEANAAGTIAVVTHTINVNADGVATAFGLVRGFDTTGDPYGETWLSGDKLYVSPSSKGHPTNIKPAYPDYCVCIGTVLYSHANNGVIFVNTDRIDGAIEQAINTRKPFHGVESGEVITFNPTTKIATLGSAGGTFAYWWKGTRFVTDQDITADLSGEIANSGSNVSYFVYFDDASGVPVVSPSAWNLEEHVPYGVVFWNGTVGRPIDERHGYTRDLAWHTWAHLTVGVRWRTGFDLLTLTGTGATASMTLSGGELMDEDLRTVVQASADWATPNAYAHFYQTAAGTYTCKDSLSTIPFLAGANNRPQLVNVSTYTLTEVASAPNRFCNFFVYGIQDPIAPVWIFAETVSNATATAGGYTTLANARAAGWPNLSGLNLSPELKPLYRVVVRADGVVQTTVAADDYRSVSNLPQAAGSASTTANLVTTGAFDGPLTGATTVEAALQISDNLLSKRIATIPAVGFNLIGATTEPLLISVDGTNRDWRALRCVDGATEPTCTVEIPSHQTSKYLGGTINVYIDLYVDAPGTVTGSETVIFGVGISSLASAGAMDTAPPSSSTGYATVTHTITTGDAGKSYRVMAAISTPGLTEDLPWLLQIWRRTGSDTSTASAYIRGIVIEEA